MGTIAPTMGESASAPSGLAAALFSAVDQRLLALLFGQPDRRYNGAELVRLAASGKGAVQRTLERLVRGGIVTVTPVGNQKQYQANRLSPIFQELYGIVVKTVGLVEPLRHALKPLAPAIRAAFVYGSVASGADRADSDIDLMVLTANEDDVSYADVLGATLELTAQLGRQVNPTIYGPEAWRRHRLDSDGFVSRVIERPLLFVIGSRDDVP